MTLTAKIVTAILVLALGAAVVFGIGHLYESWRSGVFQEGDTAGAARVQGQWNLDTIARDKDQAEEVAAARKDEQDKAAVAAQGEKDARDRAEATAQRNAAAASQSAAAAGGLSRHLATLDADARAAGAPSVAACPALFAQQRDRAIQARSLFSACVAEYRSLGEDADGALADTGLKLDTALSWMKATGAPGADQLPP